MKKLAESCFVLRVPHGCTPKILAVLFCFTGARWVYAASKAQAVEKGSRWVYSLTSVPETAAPARMALTRLLHQETKPAGQDGADRGRRTK